MLSCEQPITESTKQTQIESRTTKIGDIENGITDLQRMESEEQDRLQLILNSLDNIRKNDVEIAKILSSIAELEKFNAKLEKDIETYQNGSVSEEDKTKLAELKRKEYQDWRTKDKVE